MPCIWSQILNQNMYFVLVCLSICLTVGVQSNNTTALTKIFFVLTQKLKHSLKSSKGFVYCLLLENLTNVIHLVYQLINWFTTVQFRWFFQRSHTFSLETLTNFKATKPKGHLTFVFDMSVLDTLTVSKITLETHLWIQHATANQCRFQPVELKALININLVSQKIRRLTMKIKIDC